MTAILFMAWHPTTGACDLGGVDEEIARSVGTGAWSLMMLRWDRVVVRGVAGLLTGHLRLDLRGMGAIVIAQGLWNLAVAA